MSRPDVQDAIKRAQAGSPFLAGLLERHTRLAATLNTGDFDIALAAALAFEGDDVAAKLRLQRQGVALVTGIADLSGEWDFTKVTHLLSDFADDALDAAIAAAIGERYGCEPRGFAVIALGKHGGRELNYSSDIDPIFIYDPKKLPHHEKEDVAEAAVRIGRRIIELLNARDENGYVFRVDMRLRPTPEVSPISLPVEGAISYYESSAVAWEQAAFIRARAAAGDKELGRYFLESIESFIWRRSLDFGQIENIQQMTVHIRSHYSPMHEFGPGYDLKRGRGGIRECEFYVQAHQLIHGGRDAGLRMADTRSALSALAEAGAISDDKAVQIGSAYTALRTIEHRLQMVDDRQTHSLPDDAEQLTQLARLHGVADSQALLDELRPHIETVGAIYDELPTDGEVSRARLATDGLPLEDQLTDIGFTDTADPMRRIQRWRSGKLRAIRSETAISAFEATLPEIMRALAQAPDPEKALARFDNVIEKLPSAINFFHLLGARPALLHLLADILSYAPVLADALGQKIDLLDRLFDATALELPGNVDALSAELSGKCTALPYETKLDCTRDFVGEYRFALGAQLIEGQQFTLAIARSYAHLAEAALRVLAAAAVTEFEETHGRIDGGELLILALGRLGGEALTHASDLDLVFLFTGSFETQSDGPKPLGATLYFNRLAQRVIAALSVATASGALYEVDTRLRPSGEQGLLCVSLDSFARYQRSDAWTWEHMALARARPVFGPDDAREQLQRVIDATLGQRRDETKLRHEIIAMRREMAKHKPPKGPLDVKLLPGGLVDMEFVTHYLQLRHLTAFHPQLKLAINTLVEEMHLPASFADAHDLLTKMLVTLRLVAPNLAEPPEAAKALIARSLGCNDWQASLAAIKEAREAIQGQWIKYLGARDFE
ncbi:MAG: bifunctional [glutamate--ammonia ligase]-adenylyl-L-tyrosine phosphorylase/[glutamate--ammonia-ligase] adenylyltransferase [Sphingorhabdus sp.]